MPGIVPTYFRKDGLFPGVIRGFLKWITRQLLCYQPDRPRRTEKMRLMFALCVCLGVAASVSAQDNVAKGKQLFTDQKCTLCHSTGGAGNQKGPLDGVASKLSADDLRLWISDSKSMTAKTKATRKPPMKQYTLAKEEIDALVAYLSTLKK
jgi:mono/diheme cytochrome c family protein